MKPFAWAWYVAVALIVLGCAVDNETGTTPPEVDFSAIVGPFKATLVSELTAALAVDSVSAIGVCNVRAGIVTDSLSQNGVQIGRTSHRLRNPDNRPEPWLDELLTSYLESGKTEPTRITLPGGSPAYVEPLFMKPLCLACHGADIPDNLAVEIDRLYPEDRATGFADGELRGLVWVTLPTHVQDADR